MADGNAELEAYRVKVLAGDLRSQSMLGGLKLSPISECRGKWPDQALNAIWGARNAGSHPHLPYGLPRNAENRYDPRQTEVHPGNPSQYAWARR